MSTPTYLEKFRYGGMSFTVCTFSSERDVNIVFEVEFLAPPKDPIDSIVARFQSDLGLKLCIALYYGVAVRHIDPMIHVDEEDDENDGFYLSINGPRCIDLLDMVSSQIGIFNVMTANLNLATVTNRIATYTLHNFNPDGGEPNVRVPYSVQTKICSMQDRGTFPSFKASPFGVEITIGYLKSDIMETLAIPSIVGDPNLLRIVIDESHAADEWFFDRAFPEFRVTREDGPTEFGHIYNDFIFLGVSELNRGTCTVRIIKRLDMLMGWYIRYASWNRMVISPADIYDQGRRMVTISPSNVMDMNRTLGTKKTHHDEGVAASMVRSMELLHANLFQNPAAFVYGHVMNWSIETIDGREFYDVQFRNLMIPWGFTEAVPKCEGLDPEPRYNTKALVFSKPGLDLQMIFPIDPINPIPGAIAYGRFNLALGSIYELYDFCSSRDDCFVKIIAGYDQWIVFAVMSAPIMLHEAITPTTPVQAVHPNHGHMFRLFRTDYLLEMHNSIFLGAARTGLRLKTVQEVFSLIIEMIDNCASVSYLRLTQDMPEDEVVMRALSLYIRTVGITNDPRLDMLFTAVVRDRYQSYIQKVEASQHEQSRTHSDENEPLQLHWHVDAHDDDAEDEAEAKDAEAAPSEPVPVDPNQVTKTIRPDVVKAIHAIATSGIRSAPDFTGVRVIDYSDDAIGANESTVPENYPSPLFGRQDSVQKHRDIYKKSWAELATNGFIDEIPRLEPDLPSGPMEKYDREWEEFATHYAKIFHSKETQQTRVSMKVLRAVGFIAGYWPDGKWRLRDSAKWNSICPSLRYQIRRALKQAFYCDVRDGIVTDENVRYSFIMYTHPNLFGSPKEPLTDVEGLTLTRPWIQSRVDTSGLATIQATTKYAYFLRPEARKKFIDDSVELLERSGFQKNQICCENDLEP